MRDRIAEDYIPAAAVRLVRALIRRLADGVVANSTATLETLPPADRGRLSWVIPASVQVSSHARARHTGATTFGMLGRIAPWKGQDLFLSAFAAAFPGGEERAVLVGAAMFGEEGYERELHELAASLGIAERVEFRGFREDVWPELAGFDVLVHASRIPEPFGTVVLEGMAAGLAVLAPDEGGRRASSPTARRAACSAAATSTPSPRRCARCATIAANEIGSQPAPRGPSPSTTRTPWRGSWSRCTSACCGKSGRAPSTALKVLGGDADQPSKQEPST